MKPNVVLIVADTLRKDFSQGLDRLLDLGFVKYDNAFSTSPWTLPSHVSMFTGLYPSQHGVHEYFGITDTVEEYGRLGRQAMGKFDNLISLLKDEGYRTLGVTANSFITPIFGFDFDEFYLIPYPPLPHLYDSKLHEFIRTKYRGSKLRLALDMIKAGKITELVKISASYLQYYYLSRTAHKGCNLILDALEKLDLSGQFFLFINEMEAHEPYSIDLVVRKNAYGEYDYNFLRSIFLNSAESSMIEHYKRYYPIHAKRSVSCVLDIVTELSKRIEIDNTLIIVTSDHGNHIGESGRVYHGYYLSDELLRVPLYVKYPRDVSSDLKVREDYVSVTSVYRLVRALVYSEALEASDLTISESYGPQHSLPLIKSFFNLANSELKKYYSHRIRISTQNGYLIYDMDKDITIEESGNLDVEQIQRLREVFS